MTIPVSGHCCGGCTFIPCGLPRKLPGSTSLKRSLESSSGSPWPTPTIQPTSPAADASTATENFTTCTIPSTASAQLVPSSWNSTRLLPQLPVQPHRQLSRDSYLRHRTATAELQPLIQPPQFRI